MTIVDMAPLHRRYRAIVRYLIQFLQAVPARDLVGITYLRLRDEVPPVASRDALAGYYNPVQTQNNGTWIDIYLGPTLLHLPDFEKQTGILGIYRNKLFLWLFGKMFLAASLFHEIGHHKNQVLDSLVFEKQSDAEEKATEYENRLLRRVFPLSQQNYELFNLIYKYMYRNRIEHALAQKGEET